MEKRKAQLAENRKLTRAGICPTCGSPIEYYLGRRFIRCVAYPAVDRRRPEYRGLPACTFIVEVDPTMPSEEGGSKL